MRQRVWGSYRRPSVADSDGRPGHHMVCIERWAGRRPRLVAAKVARAGGACGDSEAAFRALRVADAQWGHQKGS